jgi:hypothetical protein
VQALKEQADAMVTHRQPPIGRDSGRVRPGEIDPTRWWIGLTGYSLASSAGVGRDITPPEICDAIRNAATTAGTLISLKN